MRKREKHNFIKSPSQQENKEINTVVCDIYGAPGTGTLVSAEDMRKAVFKNGFNPFALGLAKDSASAAFGIDVFEGWKNTIVAQDTSDWNICARCMLKLRPYMEGKPRPTGVKKATVSASPLVGALAGKIWRQGFKPLIPRRG